MAEVLGTALRCVRADVIGRGDEGSAAEDDPPHAASAASSTALAATPHPLRRMRRD